MKTSRLQNLPTSSAFSLVEVVLAVAVVAVGLITIIGLFPQGLTSARRAMDDSFSAIIAEDTIAARRILIQTGNANIGSVAPADSRRWYTPEGTVTNDPSLAMYKCEITAKKLADGLESTHVLVVWPWYNADPVTKSPPPPNTNAFVTEIARY
jgi:hypothetical protein